jgi:hypothetical protein
MESVEVLLLTILVNPVVLVAGQAQTEVLLV